MITIAGIIGVYLSGLLGTLIVDASFGVMLYQFDYFVNPNRRWFSYALPELRYSMIIASTIAVAFFLRIKQYQPNRFLEIPFVKWWLVLCLLSVLVWPLAANNELHVKFMVLYLKTLVFGYLMFKIIDTPVKMERLIWVFLLGQFFLAWMINDVGRNSGGRVERMGPGDSPEANGVAAVVVACVPLLVFYMLKGKLWQKGLALFIGAFVLNAAILINSRGGFLGLVVAMSYMGWFMIASSSLTAKQKAQAVAIGILSLAMFIYLADAAFWDRMATLLNIEVEGERLVGNDGAHRTEFWKAGLQMAGERPLGSGFFGFNTLGHLYMTEEVSGGRVRALHNSLVQVLVEFGFAGLLFFLVLMFSVFKMQRAVRKTIRENSYLYLQSVALSACLVCTLTTAMFLDRFATENMYWLIVFMACFRNIYVVKGLEAVDSPLQRDRPVKAATAEPELARPSPYAGRPVASPYHRGQYLRGSSSGEADR